MVEMEEKEKTHLPPMKQEEIVPYILLEQLILAHKVAAERGKTISTIMLTHFILKLSKKLKRRSNDITVRYCYRRLDRWNK